MPKPSDFGATNTFAYVAPPNGGFFATQSYAMTMIFSFVAGIFLTVAYSKTRQANLAMTNTSADLVQAACAKMRGIRANWQTMEEMKMTLVVRKELKMGQGKVAAQCAHAAVGVVDRIYEESERALIKQQSLRSGSCASNLSVEEEAEIIANYENTKKNKKDSHQDEIASPPPQQKVEDSLETGEKWMTWLTAWRASGSAKVVLQVDTEEALMAIVSEARKANLPSTFIRDAGRTQIAAGSKTVCAVGPAPKSMVDKITGKLKLL